MTGPKIAAERAYLTKRESQIIKMIHGEMGNRDISEALGIALETVETHIRNIKDALTIESRIGLALWYERQSR